MFTTVVKSTLKEDISILVTKDNHPWNYLCECGDAKALTVKELQNTNAIFISHTHIDHFVNFDTVMRHQIGIERDVVICGPKGIAKQVQAKLNSYTWNLINKGAIRYEIREMLADDKIVVFELEPPTWELKELHTIEGNLLFKDKDFSVTGVLLDHKIPTLAYKFQEEELVKINMAECGFKGGKWVRILKEAFLKQEDNVSIDVEGKVYSSKELFHLLSIQKGDSLGIIMDHAANEENHSKIVEHFKNCNKVLIESFYRNEDKALAAINFHSYAALSGSILKQANVIEAVPVHFSRKYTPAQIATLEKEFFEAFTF